MMDAILEQISRIARVEAERVMRLQMMPRLANVVEYDPKTHRAKVEIQPEGVTTNWIAADTGWVGKNWGLFAPLGVGDQVKVVFPEYGSNEGIIVSRVSDERTPPPESAQKGKAGECYLVDQKGSKITLTENGIQIDVTDDKLAVAVTAPTVTVKATKSISITAPDGDIKVNGVSLVHHTHPQPNDSAGDTEKDTNEPNKV